MTTHDGTVLAAHLGTTHLAESLTAAIYPACPGNLQWVNVGDGIMQAVGCTHCNIFKPAPRGPSVGLNWPHNSSTRTHQLLTGHSRDSGRPELSAFPTPKEQP